MLKLEHDQQNPGIRQIRRCVVLAKRQMKKLQEHSYISKNQKTCKVTSQSNCKEKSHNFAELE